VIGATAVVTARYLRIPWRQHGPHNPGAIPLANPERARDVAGRTGKSDDDIHTNLGS
jgi:hypothetical protein